MLLLLLRLVCIRLIVKLLMLFLLGLELSRYLIQLRKSIEERLLRICMLKYWREEDLLNICSTVYQKRQNKIIFSHGVIRKANIT